MTPFSLPAGGVAVHRFETIGRPDRTAHRIVHRANLGSIGIDGADQVAVRIVSTFLPRPETLESFGD